MNLASSKPQAPNPPSKVVTLSATHFPPFVPQLLPVAPESDVELEGADELGTEAADDWIGATALTSGCATTAGVLDGVTDGAGAGVGVGTGVDGTGVDEETDVDVGAFAMSATSLFCCGT